MSLPGQSNGGIRPQEVTRKRFQQTAVMLIDAHAETLKNHDARITIVTNGLVDLTETVTHNAAALKAVAADLTAFVHLGFWDRLRWIFTGK